MIVWFERKKPKERELLKELSYLYYAVCVNLSLGMETEWVEARVNRLNSQAQIYIMKELSTRLMNKVLS